MDNSPDQNHSSSELVAHHPAHRYDLATLRTVQSPKPPVDFQSFWQRRFQKVSQFQPRPALKDTGRDHAHWRIFDLNYDSTDGTHIGGWLLLPNHGRIEKAIVVSHGYGGRDAPDLNLPFQNVALVFPCCRGLGRSLHHKISSEAHWHVLHDIDKVDHYVHGGCVEDIWLAFTVTKRLFPQTSGRLGYVGESFGGGIGALALAWDHRVQRAQFNVPSFGHHPLRLQIPTLGSAASVQRFHQAHPKMTKSTLAYYDAATAARHIRIPVQCACALRDPVVTPPGQFAIFNQLAGPKELTVLSGGHLEYPGKDKEHEELRQRTVKFFAAL